jgi:NAD(P)H-flavin reductase
MSALAVSDKIGRDEMVPRVCEVHRVVRETFDTFTLELDVSGFPGGRFQFRPGQFNMLYTFGIGEVAAAISGDPDDDTRLLHTIRATGHVTTEMRRLTRGAEIAVRGPYGNTWPLEEIRGRDIVMITGGIGIAAIRPVLHVLMSRRSEYGRLVLLYGARSKAEALFTRQLDKWKKHLDVRSGIRSGLPRLELDPANAAVLLCGPEVMMRAVFREMEHRHVPDDSVWLSLERKMRCGIGLCGHCQMGPHIVCRDGPVYRYDRIRSVFGVREL